MTTLTTYISDHRTARKIPADIIKRWRERVTPRNLHQLGAEGAEQYLADYGRGIGAPKVILLALQAEAEQCPEMALGFWRKAFELEMGYPAPALRETPSVAAAVAHPTYERISSTSPQCAELPSALQPGQLITMQPVDAPHSREWYIHNPQYWGQPKRDGNRLVIFITAAGVFYQSRSLKLRARPSAELERALLTLRPRTVILDGELYYADANGGEHRTGAQAATANMALGRGGDLPQTRYAIFKALYFDRDLTSDIEAYRIVAGGEAFALLQKHTPLIEFLQPACTVAEKQALINAQQADGREGEIWINPDCTYIGGKDTRRFPLVRTKYITELDVLITGLTPTTAAQRPFGAIEVVTLDGKPLGAIGTGFNSAQMREIARRHQTTPGAVKIRIGTQGFTETGQAWHGRFVDFA